MSGVDIGSPEAVLGGGSEPIFAGQAARRSYRANASRLPERAWRELDDLMIEVAQSRLSLVQRLISAGLVDPIDLGTTVSTWQTTNDFGDADISMDGVEDATEDADTFDTVGIPVPLIAKGFRFSHRLGAQYNVRDTAAPKATRKVLERMEEIVVDGWARTVRDVEGNTFTIDGLSTHPDRLQPSVDGSWNTAPENVDGDIRAVIEALQADDNNHPGPFEFWCATDVEATLRAPSPNFDNIRLRQQVGELPEIADMVASSKLPDGTAYLVELDRETIDAKLVNGNVTDSAEWSSNPFQTHVKVWTGFAPRLKSDEQGQMGLAELTGLTS